MKILHVTNGYPSKKTPVAGLFVKEQIDSIDKCLDKNDVFVINTRERGRVDYLKALFALRKCVHKYDIVHAHHIYVGFLLLLVSDKQENNIVVSLMSDPERKTSGHLKNFIYKTTYKYCEKHAKGIIFKKEIPDGLNRPNVFHLPNGVDTDVFFPIDKAEAKHRLGLTESKRYILFVSSNSLHRREKRYDRFQKVVQLLHEQYGLDDVEGLAISDVSREDTVLYFNAAELHLLVSDVEGSPNSVKESIACNTPVVSTNVGNVDAMIGSLGTCKVVSSFDEKDIADAVRDCLNKPPADLRKQIEVLKLDVNSIAKQLCEIYANLAHDNS